MSKSSHFVLVAFRLPTVECDLLALLSDTQVWSVRVSLQETLRSGISVATEPLGFHLQMKTTWPAAWVRWEPDGCRQAGRAARAMASGLFPPPIAWFPGMPAWSRARQSQSMVMCTPGLVGEEQQGTKWLPGSEQP